MPRPRRLIVDAYNVLHVTGVLAPVRAGPDLAELAELISISRWGTLKTSLVCDGAIDLPLTLPDRIEAIYAGAGRDADSLIEVMLEEDSAPRSIRVISSDRRLRTAARRRRAGWMGSEEFLRRLNQDAGRGKKASLKPPRPDSLPPTGVQAWLHRFGVAPDDPLLGLRSAAGSDQPAGEEGSRNQPQQDASALPRVEQDPLIEEALDEWRDRLSRDDLDMSKWMTDIEPMRDDEPPSSS